MKTKDTFPLSSERKAQGFGTFPYVIVRVLGGTYMQFPIHLYEHTNPEKPGLRVRVDSLQNEEHNFTLFFHVVRQFHEQINSSETSELKICLVISQNEAYFFEENEFKFSNEIPEGGSLIDSQYKVLALNSAHFILD